MKISINTLDQNFGGPPSQNTSDHQHQNIQILVSFVGQLYCFDINSVAFCVLKIHAKFEFKRHYQNGEICKRKLYGESIPFISIKLDNIKGISRARCIMIWPLCVLIFFFNKFMFQRKNSKDDKKNRRTRTRVKTAQLKSTKPKRFSLRI